MAGVLVFLWALSAVAASFLLAADRAKYARDLAAAKARHPAGKGRP